MGKNAKVLMIGMQVVGVVMAIIGLQVDSTPAIFFGIAIAVIGGLVGKMQREDDTAGH